MDRLTAMLYPGGSREQYRYDAVGNPVGYTTRAGQIRTSVFDNRNREIQTNWNLRGRALILDMIPITDSLFAVAFEQI
jgi:YD repeat-containing protein